MKSYYKTITKALPRLPIEGSIDLTYRCNNNCRHCWVVEPNTKEVRKSELTTREWIEIFDHARAMGTSEWLISGGEPILRQDFSEIIGYIASHSSSYSLNTNGTLITPAIAQGFKNHGIVMISLYGATEHVHDNVTRNPGSFNAAIQGLAYLREAGVRFMIQLVPMKDNFHQWEEMKTLAQKLCPLWRMGALVLHYSASGDKIRNEEIQAQRLAPSQLVDLSPPNIAYDERQVSATGCNVKGNQRTYDFCISDRQSFHVDPKGGMSFCCLIKEEGLRYDLKKGSFEESWETFIPSLAQKEQISRLYNTDCHFCEAREYCQKCPAMNYLEHRHATVPSLYLCQYSKGQMNYKKKWKELHQRHFSIAGITIQLNCEKHINDKTFSPALKEFMTETPGDDVIQLEHFFFLPQKRAFSPGPLVYKKPPWQIYNKGDTWTYINYIEQDGTENVFQVAEFTENYSHGRLFSLSDHLYQKGNLHSLSIFSTDMIWLAHPLLKRNAFYVHSCGLVVDGNGLLFVGHSEAGKSTMAKLFRGKAELLCDDRIILRQWLNEGWCIHGTWSHGELPEVSSASASFRGLFFIEKSTENTVTPLLDHIEIKKRLTPCLIRPYVDVTWWERILPLVSSVAKEVPAYVVRFDTSGEIVRLIREIEMPARNNSLFRA
jgi:radical SAM protein with 4Fe4S-binding SPASM domain